MSKTVWYVKDGSDAECIYPAIIMASATGSIGATECHTDEQGNVMKTATVMREGHQEADYHKLVETI